jgi:RNA-directed DNA polymerase
MASLKQFIEKRLRLKVNMKKSAVARPSDRHFVGFSLVRNPIGEVRIVLSKRSLERIGKRIVELTPRN